MDQHESANEANRSGETPPDRAQLQEAIDGANAAIELLTHEVENARVRALGMELEEGAVKGMVAAGEFRASATLADLLMRSAEILAEHETKAIAEYEADIAELVE